MTLAVRRWKRADIATNDLLFAVAVHDCGLGPMPVDHWRALGCPEKVFVAKVAALAWEGLVNDDVREWWPRLTEAGRQSIGHMVDWSAAEDLQRMHEAEKAAARRATGENAEIALGAARERLRSGAPSLLDAITVHSADFIAGMRASAERYFLTGEP